MSTAAASDAAKAVFLERTGVGKLQQPVFADFVEDSFRSRLLTTVTFTAAFVLAVFTLVFNAVDTPSVPSGVGLVSTPPSWVQLHAPLVRLPRVQVVAGGTFGVEGANVTVAVTHVQRPRDTGQPVDCTTTAMQQLNNTLDGDRVAALCRPEVVGGAAVTDSVGLATFHDLALASGPPARWTLTFQSGVFAQAVEVDVLSTLFNMYLLTKAPATAVPGVPLSTQPRVLLVDQRGQPLVGRRVWAYVAPGPYLPPSNALETHGVQGQRHGVLANAVSAPSGADGVATWSGLTVTASSAADVFIAFYAEGVAVSWATFSGQSLFAQSFQSEVPALPPAIALGVRMVTTVCRLTVVTPASATATEGRPFRRQPVVEVTDGDGRPVAGVTVLALVQQLDDAMLPALMVPSLGPLPLKRLTHAASAPSDAAGRAVFTLLGTQTRGSVSRLGVVYAAHGVFSRPQPAIHVTTTVAAVQLASVPVQLPLLPIDPEAVATVRAVDAQGLGVGGKTLSVALVFANGTAVPPDAGHVDVVQTEASQSVSGADGYLAAALRFGVLTNATAAHDLRLRFVVDGVAANLSLRVSPASSPVAAATAAASLCAALVATTPLPDVVTAGVASSLAVTAVDVGGLPVPGVEVAVFTLSQALPRMYPQVGPRLFTLSGDTAATTGAAGVARLPAVVVSGPSNATALVQVAATDGACASDVMAVTVVDAVLSVEVVPPGVDCPQPGSGHAYTASCGCVDGQRPPVHDAGTVAAGVPVPVSVQLRGVGGVPVSGRAVVPSLVQVPPYIALRQFKGGVGDTTTMPAGDVVTAFGSGADWPRQQPFLTVTSPAGGTDADGVITVRVVVAAGYPGTYSLVLASGLSAATAPVVLQVPSSVASLQVVTQPAFGTATGHGATVGRVGDRLTVQPRVRVADAAGVGLPGYQVSTYVANDDCSRGPAAVDFVTALGPVGNVLAYGMSDPSDANGVAAFSDLVFLDALTGCYRFVFVTLNVTNATATYSDAVCVVNLDTYTLSQQPSAVASPLTPLPAALRVAITRPYVSDLFTAGTLAAMALVRTYKHSRRPLPGDPPPIGADGQPDLGTLLLTPTVLSRFVCMYVDGVGVSGAACSPLNVTTGVNPAAGEPFQDATAVTVEFGFQSLTWEGFAREGDAITVSGFSPVIYAQPSALQLRRYGKPDGDGGPTSATCVGPATGGAFGECCDHSAQCASGVCDAARRSCTVACTADSDCPVAPSSQAATCLTASPVDTCAATVAGGPAAVSTGMCLADVARGWSFAPYCSVCHTGQWVGGAGPDAVANAGSLRTVLTSLIATVCASPTVGADLCADTVTANATREFVEDMAVLCSTVPAALRSCRFGVSEARIVPVVRALAGQSDASLPPDAQAAVAAAIANATADAAEVEARVGAALGVLLLQPTAAGPGFTSPSVPVVMASTPSGISVVRQPPSTVVVGDVFEVVVQLTVASGAALPFTRVTSALTPAAQANLAVGVDDFLNDVSGTPGNLTAPWLAARLDGARTEATTDDAGFARLRLSVAAAADGQYFVAVQSTAATGVAVVTDTFAVTNPVARVEVTAFAGASATVTAADLPHRLEVGPVTVAVHGVRGMGVSGKSASVRLHVLAVADDGAAAGSAPANATSNTTTATPPFQQQWASLSATGKLATLFSLLLQGSRRMAIGAPQPANVDLVHGAWVERGNQPGVYDVAELTMVVHGPGSYQVMAVVDAIPAPLTPAVTLALAGGTVTGVLEKAGVTVLFALLCWVSVGNSTWHASGWWLLLSAAAAVVALALTLTPMGPSGAIQLGFVIVLFGVILVLQVAVGLRHLLSSAPDSFAATRRRTFHEYVRAMFNGRQAALERSEWSNWLSLLSQQQAARRLLADRQQRAVAMQDRAAELTTARGCVTATREAVQRLRQRRQAATASATDATATATPTAATVMATNPIVRARRVTRGPPPLVCGRCNAVAPVETCATCQVMLCRRCTDVVHQGAMRVHVRVQRLDRKLLPATSLARMVAREEEREWYLSSRRSVTRHATRALVSTWRQSWHRCACFTCQPCRWRRGTHAPVATSSAATPWPPPSQPLQEETGQQQQQRRRHQPSAPRRYRKSVSGILRPVDDGRWQWPVDTRGPYTAFDANPDAFFYPTRLILAAVVSLLTSLTLFGATVSVLVSLRKSVATLDAAAVRAVFVGAQSVEELFLRTTRQDLFEPEVAWAFDQAAVLHDEVQAFANALLTSFVVASVVALVAFGAAWALLFADFRMQVLEARRGRWQFDKSVVRLATASNYIGLQISNSFVSYVIMLLASCAVSLVFVWPLLISSIASYWLVIIVLVVVPFIVGVVLLTRWLGRTVLTSTAAGPGTPDTITSRRSYMSYDTMLFFTAVYTGVVSAVLRLLTVLAVAFFSLARIDRSPLPDWIPRRHALDAAHNAYNAVILQHATFHNPVACVFAWTLLEAAAARRAELAQLTAALKREFATSTDTAAAPLAPSTGGGVNATSSRAIGPVRDLLRNGAQLATEMATAAAKAAATAAAEEHLGEGEGEDGDADGGDDAEPAVDLEAAAAAAAVQRGVRVARRFQLAVLLLKYPQLQQYRHHSGRPSGAGGGSGVSAGAGVGSRPPLRLQPGVQVVDRWDRVMAPQL